MALLVDSECGVALQELFDNQTTEYKKSLFPDGVPVMSVECSATRGSTQLHCALLADDACYRMGEVLTRAGWYDNFRQVGTN